MGDTRADGLSADDLAFLVWASTHGLAMLRVNRQRLPVPTRDKDGDRLTDLMVTFGYHRAAGVSSVVTLAAAAEAFRIAPKLTLFT